MLARAYWTSVTDVCWLRFRRVAGLEFCDHRLEGKAAAAKEYEQVEEQVSGLRDDFVVGFHNGGERDFESFFADFLGDTLGAFGEEPCGVAALGTVGDSLFDDALEGGEKSESLAFGDGVIAEAGSGAFVAHRAQRAGCDQQGIPVAVRADLIQLQEVARGFALLPQSLLAAAEEHNMTARHCFAQGRAIHITNHQHSPGIGVLNNRRQQALRLLEVQRIDVAKAQRVTGRHDVRLVDDAADACAAAVRSAVDPVAAVGAFRTVAAPEGPATPVAAAGATRAGSAGRTSIPDSRN